MSNRLQRQIPARIEETPPPREADYLSRAEAGEALLRGAQLAVSDIVSASLSGSAIPERMLLRAGAAKVSGNVVHETLGRIVHGIMSGEKIDDAYPTIARLIHAQEQRAEVIGQLVVTNEFARLATATRVRDLLEEDLFAAAINGDLLPSERVIVLERLDAIVSSAHKNVVNQATSAGDISALLDKLDYATEMAGSASLKKKFADTTAQGREVVRKILTRVNRAVRSANEPAA